MEPIPERRLSAQQLSAQSLARAQELVARFGAIQAQDYAACKWAVGMRLREASEADVEGALAGGALIRLHAFRGTWQLCAPEDAGWMISLGAARMIAKFAPRLRELGIDEAGVVKTLAAWKQAVAGDASLTREELTEVLAEAGLPFEGTQVMHLLLRAELDGWLCNGPRRGKQFTYTRLDRLAPRGRKLSRPAALAELARRYFVSRGPATLDDFVWWSGLTVKDARAGLEAAGAELVSEELEGETYWCGRSRASTTVGDRAHLIPAFDEYLVAYRARRAVLDPEQARRHNAGGGMLNPCVLLDGRVAGTWRRELAKSRVRIALDLFGKTSRAERAAIDEAAERYAAFLGLAPEVLAP